MAELSIEEMEMDLLIANSQVGQQQQQQQQHVKLPQTIGIFRHFLWVRCV